MAFLLFNPKLRLVRRRETNETPQKEEFEGEETRQRDFDSRNWLEMDDSSGQPVQIRRIQISESAVADEINGERVGAGLNLPLPFLRPLPI